MSREDIPVKALLTEKTYVGNVDFPESTPEGLIELILFPNDLFTHAKQLDLNDHALKFLIAAMRGKWSITVNMDLPEIHDKTGLSFAEMDRIVRDLINKNYARMDERLNLYRLWVCMLHVKGVRFVEAEEE